MSTTYRPVSEPSPVAAGPWLTRPRAIVIAGALVALAIHDHARRPVARYAAMVDGSRLDVMTGAVERCYVVTRFASYCGEQLEAKVIADSVLRSIPATP